MKIALLGCKGTTLDLLNNFVSQRALSLEYVITLPARLAKSNNVAFYKGAEIESYCQKVQIPTYTVKSYGLTKVDDRRFFEAAEIDLLLVIG